MRGVILAVLDRPGAATALLAAAERLAVVMGGAHINALAVRMPPEATITTEEVLPTRARIRIETRERERSAALRADFDIWIAQVGSDGIAAEWIDLEGLADAVVEDWGRRADVIVLARPERGDQLPAHQEIHAALFRTDRPVLIIPPTPLAAFGRCVAIAWRDDRCAARAVLSMLHCRVRPDKLLLFAGVRADAPPPVLPDILIEHGIEAELHVLPIGPEIFGAALLGRAHALGADMLVMGAYAHGKLRAMILGGVTRYMLAHADLPVLMRH